MAALFALGSNGSGQLGIGHSEDVSIPKNVIWADKPPRSISTIATGGNHSLVLSGEGVLYWSGDATTGSCGSQAPDGRPVQPSFAKLKIGQGRDRTDIRGQVGMVAATWEASVFSVLDDHGKNTIIYSCGTGQKGELGQGPLIVRDPKVSQIQQFPPKGSEIVDLAACMSHVVAVMDNGEVYGWGNGRKGQLGIPEANVFSPRKIEGIDFAVRRAVCGKDFTCLIGDAEFGKILVIGQDKWDIKSKAPFEVRGWLDIGAGWSNICILKDDGSILLWGRNDYLQSMPPDGYKAKKIAVGSEHVLALLETGDVFAWGWGEHGNCGPFLKKNGTGKRGQRNVIAASRFLPSGTIISGIGAGCATSWVAIERIVKDKPELEGLHPGAR